MIIRRKMLAGLTMTAAFAGAVASAMPAAAHLRPITAADVIQTRRPLDSDPLGTHQVLVSPDGRKYATVLMQGDLQRDGYWVDILVGRTDSLPRAYPHTVARLFTRALKDDRIGLLASTYPGHDRFIWLADSERLAFLWSDGTAPAQVRVLNVRTGEMRWLTHHRTSVLRFGISGDGRSIVYLAFPEIAPDQDARLRRQGFAVPGISYALFSEGDLTDLEPWYHLEPFFLRRGMMSARRVRFTSGPSSFQLAWPSVSPAGRFALIPRRSFPQDVTVRERTVGDLALLDLRTGVASRLLELPMNASANTQIVWSKDDSRVAVGPAVAPRGVPPAAGEWAGVDEVDLGQTRPPAVTALTGRHGGYRPARWCDDGGLELSRGDAVAHFARVDGTWREQAPSPGERCGGVSPARVALQWREGPDTPPALFAIDVLTRRAERVLDPDPRLRGNFDLGHVEIIKWPDSDGRQWEGRLYLPIHLSSARRYPLVIQTAGISSSTEFTLLGRVDRMTALAAQILAGRGMAVLELSQKPLAGVMGTPEEAPDVMRGCEAAIRYLVHGGLADPRRIGLTGYSRTAYWVAYMLTHSSFPYAAAIESDGLDISYVQLVLTTEPGRYAGLVGTAGEAPFGQGLPQWLRTAPGFNADKVHTPLRLEVASGGVEDAFLQWEMYSRLKLLHRPVELVIDPDGEHADHPLQVPSQQLASIQGTVDWMDFWLNGRESPDPSKRAQNARWRMLRQQQIGLGESH